MDQIARGTLTEASSTVDAPRITPARPEDTKDLTGEARPNSDARVQAGQEALSRGRLR